MKGMLLKIVNYSTSILLAVMLAFGALYAWEHEKPPSDYLTYYGHITQQAEFHSPESVTLVTFGVDVEPVDLLEVYNQMLCTPLTSRSNTVDFIGGIHKTFYNWKFQNQVPSNVSEVQQVGDSISRIGVVQREEILNAHTPLKPWTMGDLKPIVSSECYVTSELLVFSHMFKVPKTLHFRGNNFIYYVDKDT